MLIMKRSAFTLVELLVVIVVISLLAALLLPAVNMARETARRAQCVSRQRDLAIALIEYAASNNGLPGYLNQPGESLPVYSWAVAVMPGIGENKRYEVLMRTPDDPQAVASLSALLCPSDNPREPARLNYIVNCGPDPTRSGIGTDNLPDFALFTDRRLSANQPSGNPMGPRVKIEDIPDGAANTILLSENVDAGFWHSVTGWSGVSSSQAVRDIGFLWARQSDFLPVSSVGFSSESSTLPRPSARHPGIVVAAFADGSARVINDDIPLEDWFRSVCPDDRRFIELAP